MPDEATLAEPAAICLLDKAVLWSKECEGPAAQEGTRDAPAVADAQCAEASNPAVSDGKAAATAGKVDELEVPEGIQPWRDEKPGISKEDEDRLLKVHHRCIDFHSACQWHSSANSVDF